MDDSPETGSADTQGEQTPIDTRSRPPVHWFHERRDFGIVASPQFIKTSTPVEKWYQLGAEQQHRVSRLVRDELRRARRSVASLGVEVGVTERTLQRMLAGDTHMDAAVMIALVEAMGRHVRVQFEAATSALDDGD